MGKLVWSGFTLRSFGKVFLILDRFNDNQSSGFVFEHNSGRKFYFQT